MKIFRKSICLLVLLSVLLCGCGSRKKEYTFNLAESAEQQIETGIEQQNDGTAAQQNDSTATLQNDSEGMKQKDGSSLQQLYVHVCGAVYSPGVVTVPEGSRAEAAVAAAGGMTAEADDAYVNLAALVEDGQKLYIPTKEEALRLETSAEAEEKGLVNINRADAGTLCTLPGIGESKAADIIAYRQKYGDFQTIEDIMKVPGIKESAFAKIEGSITVD